VEFGNDATCPVIGSGPVSFLIASGDVFELDDVLYIPGSTKSLLSISWMTNLQCMSEFDSQQMINKKCSPELG
jgi:hypothetical protein